MDDASRARGVEIDNRLGLPRLAQHAGCPVAVSALRAVAGLTAEDEQG